MTDQPKTTAAAFELVAKGQPGKFNIMSLDDNKLKVEAQFNPKELEITKEVPWGVPGDAGGANGGTKQGADGVEMQFTGRKGRTFSVTLMFDDVHQDRKGGVAANVEVLEKMTTVIDPKSKEENKRRPHWCVATWGSGLPGFRCVITSLKTKYLFFDTNGDPLRVECVITLAEASSVSIKDHNPKPKPPGAPAGSSSGSSGGGSSTPPAAG